MSCKYFTTSLFDLDRPCAKDLSGLDSFVVVMCVGGSGSLVDRENDGEEHTVTLRQGETVLIPATSAAIEFRPDPAMTCLASRIE